MKAKVDAAREQVEADKMMAQTEGELRLEAMHVKIEAAKAEQDVRMKLVQMEFDAYKAAREMEEMMAAMRAEMQP